MIDVSRLDEEKGLKRPGMERFGKCYAAALLKKGHVDSVFGGTLYGIVVTEGISWFNKATVIILY